MLHPLAALELIAIFAFSVGIYEMFLPTTSSALDCPVRGIALIQVFLRIASEL
jgi:hypothetical protein